MGYGRKVKTLFLARRDACASDLNTRPKKGEKTESKPQLSAFLAGEQQEIMLITLLVPFSSKREYRILQIMLIFNASYSFTSILTTAIVHFSRFCSFQFLFERYRRDTVGKLNHKCFLPHSTTQQQRCASAFYCTSQLGNQGQGFQIRKMRIMKKISV